jgi:hypothetical protein
MNDILTMIIEYYKKFQTVTVTVLNLCADDYTYKRKKYANVVHSLYKQYYNKEVSTNFYYIGDVLTTTNANDACKANLLSTERPFDQLCFYNTNTFDVIISEGCPTRSESGVFNEFTLGIIKNILKPNGFLCLPFMRSNQFWYEIGPYNRQDIIQYMTNQQNYKYLGELSTTDTYLFGSDRVPKREHLFYIFQNQK